MSAYVMLHRDGGGVFHSLKVDIGTTYLTILLLAVKKLHEKFGMSSDPDRYELVLLHQPKKRIDADSCVAKGTFEVVIREILKSTPDGKSKKKNKAKTPKRELDGELESDIDDSSSATKKPKSSTKKKKDPNAPKRPPRAYDLFCNDHKAKVQEENNDLTAKEVLEKTRELWKNASDDVKQKYEKLAEPGKRQYKEDFKRYQETPSSSGSGKKK